MSDNPFASPSDDAPPPQPPVTGPDWEHPAYQQPYAQPWGTDPYAAQRDGRFVPRSLVTACHASAAGAWAFTIVCGIVESLVRSHDGFGVLIVLAFSAVLGTVFLVGLALMFGGLVAAVPLLAIWWGERRSRTGEHLAEKAAIAHLGVAWLFALFYIVRILTL